MPTQSFSKQFLYFCRHQSFGQCLDDFLTIVLCSLALGTEEPRYLETLKRYEKKIVLEVLPPIFGALQSEYLSKVTPDGAWCDPLGELYEEYSSEGGRKMSGQFFTPPHICDLMSQMTISNPKPEKRFSVQDPACGSGRCLISVARLSPEMNRWIFAVGIDIDRVCAMMCAVNMFFHGVSGVVIHGDTLGMNIWGGWRIRPLLCRVEWLTAPQAMSYLLQKKKTDPDPVQVTNPEPQQQLSLFK